jgi:hypothetical protein
MSLLENIKQWEDQKTSELNTSYTQKGFKASGNWPKELQWVNNISPFRLNIKLLGAEYTEWMIKGRPPTSENAPKGDPTLLEIITKWIQDKRLNLNPAAVTENIHKFGTRQFYDPDPKKKALLTDVFTDQNIESLIDIIRKDQIQQITENTIKILS